jgi:cbb3-type cytochrome oxidase cytochrome c subunit
MVGSVTNAPADREIVALIAYLQRLGKDIKAAPQATNAVTTAQLAR